jgi:hypothetical protein
MRDCVAISAQLVARAWVHRGRKVLLSQQATCATCAVFLNDNFAASRGLRGAFLPHARAIGFFFVQQIGVPMYQQIAVCTNFVVP